jgi:hypothetical protein
VAPGPEEEAVRVLLKILLGGFIVFMVLAIAQEWEFFSSAWFGGEDPPPEIAEPERKAAADAVHLVLSLMSHLYSSGGDRRFSERIPVSEPVLEEMNADLDYLRRNHLRQEMELERLEIVAVETRGEDRLEIRTREYWKVRRFSLVGSGPLEHPRPYVTHGKFFVVQGDRGWRVQGWEVYDPAWEQGGSGS